LSSGSICIAILSTPVLFEYKKFLQSFQSGTPIDVF